MRAPGRDWSQRTSTMTPTPQVPPTPQRNIHSHTWIVGVLGLIAGLVLLVYVPSLPAVSQSVLLFAGFHIVGGAILLGLMERRVAPADRAKD